MDKEEMVLDAFKKAGKPLRPGDVARITGLDSKEVSKIIKKLKDKRKLIVPKSFHYFW